MQSEVKQFIEEVFQMREAQKRWFKNHMGFDLKIAKALEKNIDTKISKLLNMEPDHVKQPELFR